MADSEQLQKLRSGASVWNRWRYCNPQIRPDLEGATLAGMDLFDYNLSLSNLRQASLQSASIYRSSFCLTDLSGANLEGVHAQYGNFGGACLEEARMNGCHLEDTNLACANLRAAHFQRAELFLANLYRTNFDRTVFGDTIFANVDLSTAMGLESALHVLPSTIGIDTLYRSGCGISDLLLRRFGVPENLIAYRDSLVTKPIQFYSVFISYSTIDQQFADRLYADLQASGVRCWFASHDARFGKKLHEQIDEAIRVHEKLLLILSPASMASEWVKTEISKARAREIKEKRRILFPISLCPFSVVRKWECFDADTGKDSAKEIREYLIPDFSKWRNFDDYHEKFDRLLASLRDAPAH